MPNVTPNYNLTKPLETEFYDIGVQNDNMDTIDEVLADKVDKVTGKGLSTNDYTTEEKNKLAGIQAGAQVNAVTSVAGKTGAVTLTKSDVGLANVDAPDDGYVQIGNGADASSSGGQVAIGQDAYAESNGIAIGDEATVFSNNGITVGGEAHTEYGGISVGYKATSGSGVSIGKNTLACSGVAIGDGAWVGMSINDSINAIQLGTGTNNTDGTFQVYSYQLLDASGMVPHGRIGQSGTWTPKIVSSTANAPTITYNRQDGDWVRIGNIVWCNFTIWMASYSKGSADGSIVLGGLPFTPYGGLGRNIDGVTLPAYINPASGIAAYEFRKAETNGIALIKRSAGGGGLYCKYASDGSIFNNNTEFAGSLCYRIA